MQGKEIESDRGDILYTQGKTLRGGDTNEEASHGDILAAISFHTFSFDDLIHFHGFNFPW